MLTSGDCNSDIVWVQSPTLEKALKFFYMAQASTNPLKWLKQGILEDFLFAK